MPVDVALAIIPLGPSGGLAGNHGLAGLLVLAVGLLAGLAGMVLKGRWRPPLRYNRMTTHYVLSAALTVLVALVFGVGLYLMQVRDLAPMRTLHGLNGFLLLGVTSVSLATSPCITRRYFGKLRHHSASVYIAVALLVVQVALGISRLIDLAG